MVLILLLKEAFGLKLCQIFSFSHFVEKGHFDWFLLREKRVKIPFYFDKQFLLCIFFEQRIFCHSLWHWGCEAVSTSLVLFTTFLWYCFGGNLIRSGRRPAWSWKNWIWPTLKIDLHFLAICTPSDVYTTFTCVFFSFGFSVQLILWLDHPLVLVLGQISHFWIWILKLTCYAHSETVESSDPHLWRRFSGATTWLWGLWMYLRPTDVFRRIYC